MQASTAIQISIHAPLAGNDYTIPQIVALCRISIHAPLAGNDDLMSNIRKEERNFNPRPPLRGTTCGRGSRRRGIRISIHAPLAGNDSRQCRCIFIVSNFNPRSPCGERLSMLDIETDKTLFQSTLPLRGTTLHESDNKGARTNFNPRSPCGERPEGHRLRDCADRISIHAPLAGNDAPVSPLSPFGIVFQSTLPLRGTTRRWAHAPPPRGISIHAPLAGNDAVGTVNKHDS